MALTVLFFYRGQEQLAFFQSLTFLLRLDIATQVTNLFGHLVPSKCCITFKRIKTSENNNVGG